LIKPEHSEDMAPSDEKDQGERAQGVCGCVQPYNPLFRLYYFDYF